jgi:hypothetical protein
MRSCVCAWCALVGAHAVPEQAPAHTGQLCVVACVHVASSLAHMLYQSKPQPILVCAKRCLAQSGTSLCSCVCACCVLVGAHAVPEQAPAHTGQRCAVACVCTAIGVLQLVYFLAPSAQTLRALLCCSAADLAALQVSTLSGLCNGACRPACGTRLHAAHAVWLQQPDGMTPHAL